MYDLIIIGGGAAGIMAAYTAKEGGVEKILLLEQLGNVGGNSGMAGGNIYAVNTPYTQPGSNSETEELGAALYWHHYDMIQPDLIRNWINESKNTLAFVESRGHKYRLDRTSDGYTHSPEESPGVMWFHNVLRPLAKELEEKGVEIRKSTTVSAVVKNTEGAVCGVIAQQKGGEEETIPAKSVLLSSGGFLTRPELCHKYAPLYYTEDSMFNVVPSPGNGIEIAQSGGAYINKECSLVKEFGMTFEMKPGAPGRIFATPGTVLVNKVGNRYVNEDQWHFNYSSNSTLHQPGQIGYVIYSQETLEKALTMGPEGPEGQQDEAATEKMRKETEAYLAQASEEGKFCRYCDTVAEMAEWIGCKPEVLQATIDRYNGFCEEGVDRDFCKSKSWLLPLRTGPYLVIKMIPMYIDTIGPVAVDGELRAVDENRDPIPGFYVAGVLAAGWEGRDYMRFGSALSFACTSGRIVGMTVAKDLKSDA